MSIPEQHPHGTARDSLLEGPAMGDEAKKARGPCVNQHSGCTKEQRSVCFYSCLTPAKQKLIICDRARV